MFISVSDGECSRIFSGWQQFVKRLSRGLQIVISETLVQPLKVVVVDEGVQGLEAPSLLVTGLEEPLDLVVRLRSIDRTEGMLYVVLGDTFLEGVICVPVVARLIA